MTTLEQVGSDTAAGARKPGWRRRRGWIKLLAWLLAPIVLTAGAFQLQLSYLVLDIPVAKHTGGGDFWWEQQFSQLAYADAVGVLYLHRQVGTGYPSPHGWHTVEQAFDHFDRWLKQNGWKLSGPWVDSTMLPESQFLGSD